MSYATTGLFLVEIPLSTFRANHDFSDLGLHGLERVIIESC